MSTHESEVVRYHTAARRQPQLIGKDPSGVPIWGAPYTLYQLAGLATIPIMWKTRPIWAGQLSGIAAVAVIAMSTAAVVWLLGRIDFSGRNVIYAGGALLNAWVQTTRRGPHLRRGRPGTRVTGASFHPLTRAESADEPGGPLNPPDPTLAIVEPTHHAAAKPTRVPVQPAADLSPVSVQPAV